MSESKRNKGSEYCKASQPIGNTFVNDGSFLEMFRKRMEENKTDQPGPKTESRTKELKTENREGTSGQSESGSSSNASGDKPIIQGFVGKRKALMKASELKEKRKKRREQLEEQEEEDTKSDAWKAYMAEVKEYQAKNCSEEVHNRPLVK